MNENDPFSAFEQERTIIKPGAGRAAPATAQAQGPAAAAPAAAALPDDLPLPQGLNPLLQLAAPLLSAATQLRSMAQHPNPAGLRAALIESVKRFARQAQAKGLPAEHVVAARYILCSFIDECASSTPWGGSGAWSSQSLLVHFHNESWGGEKVFQLLGKLAENVAGQRPLLELLQVVLALGFEGRYRVIDNGRAQLDSVSERLASLLREQAGPPLRELSPQWRGVALGQAKLADGLPLWVLAALAAGLLLLVFIALRLSLHARTDATFDALQAMDVRAATLTPPPPPPAAAPRLAGCAAGAGPGRQIHRDHRRRRLLRAWQRRSRRCGEAAAGRDRGGAGATARAGHGHGPHGQPADPLAALPVQLRPVARTRRVRAPAAAADAGRPAPARRRRGGQPPRRRQRHTGRSRPQPPRRDHARRPRPIKP
jgi:type VI secretion system protein ImpK